MMSCVNGAGALEGLIGMCDKLMYHFSIQEQLRTLASMNSFSSPLLTVNSFSSQLLKFRKFLSGFWFFFHDWY